MFSNVVHAMSISMEADAPHAPMVHSQLPTVTIFLVASVLPTSTTMVLCACLAPKARFLRGEARAC